MLQQYSRLSRTLKSLYASSALKIRYHCTSKTESLVKLAAEDSFKFRFGANGYARFQQRSFNDHVAQKWKTKACTVLAISSSMHAFQEGYRYGTDA